MWVVAGVAETRSRERWLRIKEHGLLRSLKRRVEVLQEAPDAEVNQAQRAISERNRRLPTDTCAGRPEFQNDVGQSVGNRNTTSSLKGAINGRRQGNTNGLCLSRRKHGAIRARVEQPVNDPLIGRPFQNHGDHRSSDATRKLHVRELQHHSMPTISESGGKT